MKTRAAGDAPAHAYLAAALSHLREALWAAAGQVHGDLMAHLVEAFWSVHYASRAASNRPPAGARVRKRRWAEVSGR